MGVFVKFTCFDVQGRVIESGSKGLPECLDYATIAEKEIYLNYVGGMRPETHHCYIESQGERKLVSPCKPEMSEPVDHHIFKRKTENVEQYIEEECQRLGITRNRVRHNQ